MGIYINDMRDGTRYSAIPYILRYKNGQDLERSCWIDLPSETQQYVRYMYMESVAKLKIELHDSDLGNINTSNTNQCVYIPCID